MRREKNSWKRKREVEKEGGTENSLKRKREGEKREGGKGGGEFLHS